MLIWIVDDDPDFLRLARYRIRQALPEANIVELDNAAEAVDRLVSGERPDLVVSDLVFRSVATGEDVVRAATSRGVPCILCSDVHPRWGPGGMVRKVAFLEAAGAFLSAALGFGPALAAGIAHG